MISGSAQARAREEPASWARAEPRALTSLQARAGSKTRASARTNIFKLRFNIKCYLYHLTCYIGILLIKGKKWQSLLLKTVPSCCSLKGTSLSKACL